MRQRTLEELDCPVTEVHVIPHMWLLKTTSGKIARTPNLERYRAEFRSAPALAQHGEAARASLLSTALASFVVALALYLYFALQVNASWGVYAKF